MNRQIAALTSLLGIVALTDYRSFYISFCQSAKDEYHQNQVASFKLA